MSQPDTLTIIPKGHVPTQYDSEFASRDLAIRAMAAELGKKKMSMITKMSKVEHLKESNELLQTVAEDYRKYNEYIIEQKQLQEKAIENIVSHLEHIVNSDELNDVALEQAELQRKTLLSSLSELKKTLDETIKS